MPDAKRPAPLGDAAIDPEADGDAAVRAWDRAVSPAFRGLLDATLDTKAAEKVDKKLTPPKKP
jgi:hypothetical protein